MAIKAIAVPADEIIITGPVANGECLLDIFQQISQRRNDSKRRRKFYDKAGAEGVGVTNARAS